MRKKERKKERCQRFVKGEKDARAATKRQKHTHTDQEREESAAASLSLSSMEARE